MQTTQIPEYRLPDLRERLDALIAKCDKKGLSGSIVVTYGERMERKERHVDSFGVEFFSSTWWVPVTLECTPPKLNGWEFAATIEQLDGSPAHLLRCSPAFSGERIPDHFRTCDPTYCEHCRLRRDRSETFVVFNGERVEFRQVGRQCLRDFLGHDPAMMIASAGYISEAVDSLSEFSDEGSGFRSARSWPIEYILSLTSRVVAVDGWKPAAFEERSTSSNLRSYLCLGDSSSDRRDADRFAQTYPETPRTLALLDRVTARCDELKAAALSEMRSDYESNLWALVQSGTCGFGHIGIVASLLAYAVRQENDAAQSNQTANSVHVGTVGERMKGIRATVTFTKIFEGDYGAKTLVKFSAGGNLLTWWATGTPELAAGDEVTLAGTVKSHEQDQYVKCAVTVLSRCKVEKMAATLAA